MEKMVVIHKLNRITNFQGYLLNTKGLVFWLTGYSLEILATESNKINIVANIVANILVIRCSQALLLSRTRRWGS